MRGSHDTARIGWLLTKISVDDASTGVQKVRLASLLQYTWHDDPQNRATYPWSDLGMSADVVMLDWFTALGEARHALSALREGQTEATLAPPAVAMTPPAHTPTTPA